MALLLAARSARSFVARAPAVRPPSARAMSSSGSYDMEGTISKIGEVQTFESGFAKIEFVVTTEEMYPQEVKFAPPVGRLSPFARRRNQAAAASAFPAAGSLQGQDRPARFLRRRRQGLRVLQHPRNERQGRHHANLQAWRLQNLAAGGGDGYASPPVASSGGASASPFDAPFSSFTADPPADGGAAPKKDDVPF
ncbi:DUF3127-containing protein [Aureococcus anophagefferens]|nr:DUF3127-containing protein [Aureococcus anophagefferens]